MNAVAVVVWCACLRGLQRVACGSRLTLNRHALVILALIGAVVATELLAQVFEVAAYGEIPGAFIASALGGALVGLGADVNGALFAAFWWAHMILVAVFLVYLPFGKHLHIATAIPNILLRKLAPGASCPRWTSGRRRVGVGRSPTCPGNLLDGHLPSVAAAAGSARLRPSQLTFIRHPPRGRGVGPGCR
jgi:hypothetical protein